MKIIIRKYEPKFEIIWNEFNEESKNGLFIFNTNFLFYHADRFVDASLLIYDDKDILLALFPANISANVVYSHQGLTYGGLILSKKVKAAEVFLIMKKICTYYAEMAFEKLIYKAIPFIFHRIPSQEDLYALFRLKANLFRRDISSVIYLNNKIGFSSSNRNRINKLVRSSFNIVEEKDPTNYWKLLNSVLKEHHSIIPTHTLSELQLLMKRFPHAIRLFTTYNEGCIVAGVLIFDFGNVVHTQYMSNSYEGRKIGALAFLNSYIIDEIVKERSCYSFGISTEDNGQFLNEGLIQQKEEYGARGIVLDTYEVLL